jgi:hypothetical protein
MKFQLNIGLSFIIIKYSKSQGISRVYNTLDVDRDIMLTSYVQEVTLKMQVLELQIQTKMVESYCEQLVSSP